MDLKNKGTDMERLVNKDVYDKPGHTAAGIVHEIRNPLTAIKGFLQLLKPYLKETGKERYADLALAEINRANDIIFEFLNASKPNGNLVQEIPLNEIIQDMATLYESEASLRNIQIITTLSANDITLCIPANYLKQILMNLIKNAMEAIDENENVHRMIHISTQNEAELASVSITDSGCGMKDETIKKIFFPFYSTKEKGTGVGLSICKELAENYNGTIHVTSTLGKGTTFTVSFPVKQRKKI